MSVAAMEANQIREAAASAIREMGMKKKRLAAKMKVHPTTLGRFLSGKTTLSGDALIILLQELNLEVGTLKHEAS